MFSAAVNHRTKKYKNTVFIILPNGSTDIPIDPDFYGAHRSDEDGANANDNDHRDNQDEDKPCAPEAVCPLPPSAQFIQSVINSLAFSSSLTTRSRRLVTPICMCA